MSKLLLAELVCFLLAVVGIGLFSVPAALIVAGVGGVAACEVHGGGPPPSPPAGDVP